MSNGTGLTWAERVGKSGDQVKKAFSLEKGITLGDRGIGFARVGVTAVGAGIAMGALRDKNPDGTDRSALARLGDLVIGGGVAAGGVLLHR